MGPDFGWQSVCGYFPKIVRLMEKIPAEMEVANAHNVSVSQRGMAKL